MGKKAPKSGSFADFEPQPAEQKACLERSSFSGLTPPEATMRIMTAIRASGKCSEITLSQKEGVLRRVLDDLHERKDSQTGEALDLASITPVAMDTYREWLAARVQRKEISESYASHIVKQWNSMLATVFGDTTEPAPGVTLKMKGFPMRAAQVEKLHQDEWDLLQSAAHRRSFRNEEDRGALVTYLELERCTGMRIGSYVLVHKGQVLHEATFSDIDWDHGTLKLRHLKTKSNLKVRPVETADASAEAEDATEDDPVVVLHEVVLTDRALTQLRLRAQQLKDAGLWQGEAKTPLLAGASGSSLRPASINRMLKDCAALAGVRKRVKTHFLRKATGTEIGKHNERLASEQLGITPQIFQKHYNVPTVDDRLERRDILPGAAWTPKSPDEIVGKAFHDYTRGRIAREELEAAMVHAEKLRALPTPRVPEVSAYL